MSASSPSILIEGTRAAPDGNARAWLKRIFFRRQLWRAIAETSLVFACVAALVCVVGAVDLHWSLARAWRVCLIVPLWLLVAVVVAHVVWSLIKRRRLVDVAREVERAAGIKRNALVTFAECALPVTHDKAAKRDAPQEGAQAFFGDEPAYIFARLEHQARQELAQTNWRIVMPRRKALCGASALALMTLVLLCLRLCAPDAFAHELRRVVWLAANEPGLASPNHEELAATDKTANNIRAIGIDEFRVRVVPPAYANESASDAPVDAPIRALVKSQIEVVVRATGASVEGATLSFGGATSRMRAFGDNRFGGSFTVVSSGALEARIIAADEQANFAPLVRAVEVYQDAPPEVRITQPAGDQLWREVPTQPLAVSFVARDDLGLQSVALKYVKSRGEGDAAKFTNGEVSIGYIQRGSAREWRGACSLDLKRQDVQPGDTFVFWIEARDRNPFINNSGRSASLSVAVRAPEAAKLSFGDLRPNEIGRFLLSERLIIIHTEKLHNERARLSPIEVARRANEIAVEQRDFKSSFNDYINIEGAAEDDKGKTGASTSLEDKAQAVADERAETHNHGIPDAPPGAPASVSEMTLAIRAMWDAEDYLSASDTARALAFEREALTRLKRAQAAVRYVPPVAPRSRPLDLKRRYAGELTEIKTQLEKLARRPAPKEAAPIRNALTDAYTALESLHAALNAAPNLRAGAITRAQSKAHDAANRLMALSGDHAATAAQVAGQLRIVETELASMNANGASDDFAARLVKPLGLLTQAATNLYAVADQTIRGGDADASFATTFDDARAADYFRRLAGRGRSAR